MTNQYAGKCAYCGMTVPAGGGTLKNERGRWVVYHSGPCPDITSGLGIGGAGSDDYNINTERDVPYSGTGQKRTPSGGGQLWQDCPRCDEQPVHLDCGYCDRHCRC